MFRLATSANLTWVLGWKWSVRVVPHLAERPAPMPPSQPLNVDKSLGEAAPYSGGRLQGLELEAVCKWNSQELGL